MAFPVTHVYFAEKIGLDSSLAIRGTLINDIGYLLPVKRISTHPYFLVSINTEELKSMHQNLSEIKAGDFDFYQGYYFHMYLDRLLRNVVFVESKNRHISLIIRCIQEKYFIRQYDKFDYILKRLSSSVSATFFIPRWKMRVHYAFLKLYFWTPWRMNLIYILFFVTGKIKVWEFTAFFQEFRRVEDIVVSQTQNISKEDLMKFYG